VNFELKAKINIFAIFLLLIQTISNSNVKFSAEFPNDHPFSNEEMWHPHLKLSKENDILLIEDKLNKIYPTQLIQLKTGMLKKGSSPKMSCGCKFINTIQSSPSFIQKKEKTTPSSFIQTQPLLYQNNAQNNNLNNNILMQQEQPNLQNINSLIYGGNQLNQNNNNNNLNNIQNLLSNNNMYSNMYPQNQMSSNLNPLLNKNYQQFNAINSFQQPNSINNNNLQQELQQLQQTIEINNLQQLLLKQNMAKNNLMQQILLNNNNNNYLNYQNGGQQQQFAYPQFNSINPLLNYNNNLQPSI